MQHRRVDLDAGTGPAGSFGVDVRMVCWGTVDNSGPLYDYGVGVESAVLTLQPVGGFG